VLTLLSLAFGLLASGALALAVATDYWLYTSEPLGEDDMQDMIPSVSPGDYPMYTNYSYYGYDEGALQDAPMMFIKVHSGLWRVCTVIEGRFVDNNQ
jgi:hypothetical protein